MRSNVEEVKYVEKLTWGIFTGTEGGNGDSFQQKAAAAIGRS